MIKTIIKRDGREESFDSEKSAMWAEEAAVAGADWPAILIDVCNRLGSTVKASDFQDAMIQSCIDKENTAHDKMAGRLYIGKMYKQCHGGIDHIPTLGEFYHEMVTLGFWADMGYSNEELEFYNNYLDHDKDLTYTYSQLRQIITKYSAQDRVNKICFETPQFTFIRMALGLAQGTPFEEASKDIWEWYEEFSNGVTNCPTPNYNNLGTYSRSYASCCLIAAGDKIGELAAADHISYMMTAASAGIGDHLKTRSVGDPVRGGAIVHSGKIPYFRAREAVVGANVQGGRGGSATTYITCNDPEIEDLVSLRNPKTVDSKRVDGIDYAFSKHTAFIERVAKDEEWPLFSYYDEPELYEAMYEGDPTNFYNLLKDYEDRNPNGKRINARKLALKIGQEEQETGRFYDFHMDEVNRHTSFKEKIYSSNLC